MKCSDLPILEIARGTMTSREIERLFEHCQQCQRCRENLTILIHLRDIYSGSFPEAEEEFRHVTLRGKRWIPLAAAALLALVILPLRDREDTSSQPPYQIDRDLPFPVQTLSSPGQSPARLEAIEAFQKGDYEKAEKLLSQLSSSPETLFLRALSLLRASHHERSIPLLNTLLDQGSPWHERALWMRAEAYLALGKTAEASADLMQIIAEGGPLQAQADQKLKERLPE